MQEETKAEYFARKIAEYDEAMTKAYGKEWYTYADERYDSEQGFFHVGLDRFLSWLQVNE